MVRDIFEGSNLSSFILFVYHVLIIVFYIILGRQFKIILTFSGSSTHNIKQTYGRLQITLIDRNGLNETFLLTSDVDDLLTSGTQVEKLIVTHPAIDPVSVHLLYVAYEGWIYTGRARWKIDKLLIIDEHGGKLSACRYFL